MSVMRIHQRLCFTDAKMLRMNEARAKTKSSQAVIPLMECANAR